MCVLFVYIECMLGVCETHIMNIVKIFVGSILSVCWLYIVNIMSVQ